MLDRRLALDPNLVFNAPLRQLDGATFMSRDQNGISCENSLAKWQLKSLLWDGADSIINCSSDLRIANIFDGGGTVSAWIKPKSDGEDNLGMIYTKISGSSLYVREEAEGAVKLSVYVYFDSTDGYWTTDKRIVTLGEWAHIAVSYNSGNVDNNPIIFVNGVAYTIGDGLKEDSKPDGTRVSDCDATLWLGAYLGNDYIFDGNITDIRLYNRILSGIEIARIYNRTKRFFC